MRLKQHAPVTIKTLSGLMWDEAKIVFGELAALGYGRSVSAAAFDRYCDKQCRSSIRNDKRWHGDSSIRGFLNEFNEASEIRRDFIRIVNARRKGKRVSMNAHTKPATKKGKGSPSELRRLHRDIVRVEKQLRKLTG